VKCAYLGLLTGSILLFGAVACLGHVGSGRCLSYEPTVLTLHGTLARNTYPGPPDYADIRKGDKAETYWLLNLDSPVCVSRDEAMPDLYPGHKNIRRVQLVLQPGSYLRYKALLGKRVVVVGTLFAAHTAHHHTDVLLTARKLEQASGKLPTD
jgi:hypothetical protein